MRKANQKKQSRNSRRTRRTSVGFADTSATHTLSLALYTSVPFPTLARAQAITWGALDGFNALRDFYQYFTPLSYRISLQELPAMTDQTITAALYPINYIVEATPTSIAFSGSTLSTMRGNVYFQPGAKNLGSWQRWPPIIQQLVMLDSAPNNLGIFMVASDLAASGNFGFRIEITCRFFRRQPFQTLSLSLVPAAPITEIEAYNTAVSDRSKLLEPLDYNKLGKYSLLDAEPLPPLDVVHCPGGQEVSDDESDLSCR